MGFLNRSIINVFKLKKKTQKLNTSGNFVAGSIPVFAQNVSGGYYWETDGTHSDKIGLRGGGNPYTLYNFVTEVNMEYFDNSDWFLYSSTLGLINITTLRSNVTTNASDIASNLALINTNTTNIASNGTAITALQAQAVNLNSSGNFIATETFTDIILTSETLPAGVAGQLAFDGTDLQLFGTAWVNLTGSIVTNASDIASNLALINTNTTNIASNGTAITALQAITPSIIAYDFVPVLGLSAVNGTVVSLATVSGKSLIITNLNKIKVVVGGTFTTGESVEVTITLNNASGVVTTVTITYSAVGGGWLTDDDIATLLTGVGLVAGVEISDIQVSANTSIAVASTVTLDVSVYGSCTAT